jgi:hypothetical protein
VWKDPHSLKGFVGEDYESPHIDHFLGGGSNKRAGEAIFNENEQTKEVRLLIFKYSAMRLIFQCEHATRRESEATKGQE